MNKVDNHPVRKPITPSTQQIAHHLANSLNLEDLKDAITTMPMSKSLVGGSMNACKTRVLNFVHMERIYQGNPGNGVIVPKFRNQLVLLERPNDGTVAMQYGDTDDVNFANIQEYGLTLPNTQYADLLAAQLCSLMMREGYQDPDDQIRPIPTSTSQCAAPSMSDGMVPELQFPETVGGQPAAGQPSGVVTTANSNMSMNSSQNLLSGARMLPPGNTQALQMSQGYFPGATVPARPQLDQASLQQQQQQNQPPQIQQQQQQQQHQQPQIQRSPLFHSNNPLSHLNTIGQNSNLQMGNHMVNKSTLQHIQMFQQQTQAPQQQQRKMMAAMAMGNMGNVNNNIVGLGGLGNVVGMGGGRGMGSSMSAPMGPMSGLGNRSQNQMSPTQITNMLNHQLRSGALSNPQAAFLANRLRMQQNRASMMGGQQSITGMSGNNPMHVGSAGLSVLGQTLNRATNMSPLQRTAMAPMGPPKTQGTNFYMNQQPQQQQLQFQQQQQLQQQQQQMQQQQMQPQQQQLGSPLQHQQSIVSQPQACSPSAMAIQQQLGSPSQASLQTPMSPQQLSSGVLQQMTAGNTGAGPASPQLSSQTLGSVNSITSSPMDLQGVSNKGNSINNNV